MAQINLLPWREERREELKKQFAAIFIIAALIGAGIVFFQNTRVQNKIDDQNRRISMIEAETRKLDKAIAEIKDLEDKRAQLISRMDVIKELQANRPVIVYHFDQLVRTLPKGVYFTSLNKKGAIFNIDGVAESYSRVSNLLRNLEESDWFLKPDLGSVDEKGVVDDEASMRFILKVPGHNALLKSEES